MLKAFISAYIETERFRSRPFFLSVLVWPLLPNRCMCRGLFLHLVTLKATHTTHTR
jgi:hypothetical protein